MSTLMSLGTNLFVLPAVDLPVRDIHIACPIEAPGSDDVNQLTNTMYGIAQQVMLDALFSGDIPLGVPGSQADAAQAAGQSYLLLRNLALALLRGGEAWLTEELGALNTSYPIIAGAGEGLGTRCDRAWLATTTLGLSPQPVFRVTDATGAPVANTQLNLRAELLLGWGETWPPAGAPPNARLPPDPGLGGGLWSNGATPNVLADRTRDAASKAGRKIGWAYSLRPTDAGHTVMAPGHRVGEGLAPGLYDLIAEAGPAPEGRNGAVPVEARRGVRFVVLPDSATGAATDVTAGEAAVNDNDSGGDVEVAERTGPPKPVSRCGHLSWAQPPPQTIETGSQLHVAARSSRPGNILAMHVCTVPGSREFVGAAADGCVTYGPGTSHVFVPATQAAPTNASGVAEFSAHIVTVPDATMVRVGISDVSCGANSQLLTAHVWAVSGAINVTLAGWPVQIRTRDPRKSYSSALGFEVGHGEQAGINLMLIDFVDEVPAHPTVCMYPPTQGKYVYMSMVSVPVACDVTDLYREARNASLPRYNGTANAYNKYVNFKDLPISSWSAMQALGVSPEYVTACARYPTYDTYTFEDLLQRDDGDYEDAEEAYATYHPGVVPVLSPETRRFARTNASGCASFPDLAVVRAEADKTFMYTITADGIFGSFESTVISDPAPQLRELRFINERGAFISTWMLMYFFTWVLMTFGNKGAGLGFLLFGFLSTVVWYQWAKFVTFSSVMVFVFDFLDLSRTGGYSEQCCEFSDASRISDMISIGGFVSALALIVMTAWALVSRVLALSSQDRNCPRCCRTFVPAEFADMAVPVVDESTAGDLVRRREAAQFAATALRRAAAGVIPEVHHTLAEKAPASVHSIRHRRGASRAAARGGVTRSSSSVAGAPSAGADDDDSRPSDGRGAASDAAAAATAGSASSVAGSEGPGGEGEGASASVSAASAAHEPLHSEGFDTPTVAHHGPARSFDSTPLITRWSFARWATPTGPADSSQPTPGRQNFGAVARFAQWCCREDSHDRRRLTAYREYVRYLLTPQRRTKSERERYSAGMRRRLAVYHFELHRLSRWVASRIGGLTRVVQHVWTLGLAIAVAVQAVWWVVLTCLLVPGYLCVRRTGSPAAHIVTAGASVVHALFVLPLAACVVLRSGFGLLGVLWDLVLGNPVYDEPHSTTQPSVPYGPRDRSPSSESVMPSASVRMGSVLSLRTAGGETIAANPDESRLFDHWVQSWLYRELPSSEWSLMTEPSHATSTAERYHSWRVKVVLRQRRTRLAMVHWLERGTLRRPDLGSDDDVHHNPFVRWYARAARMTRRVLRRRTSDPLKEALRGGAGDGDGDGDRQRSAQLTSMSSAGSARDPAGRIGGTLGHRESLDAVATGSSVGSGSSGGYVDSDDDENVQSRVEAKRRAAAHALRRNMFCGILRDKYFYFPQRLIWGCLICLGVAALITIAVVVLSSWVYTISHKARVEYQGLGEEIQFRVPLWSNFEPETRVWYVGIGFLLTKFDQLVGSFTYNIIFTLIPLCATGGAMLTFLFIVGTWVHMLSLYRRRVLAMRRGQYFVSRRHVYAGMGVQWIGYQLTHTIAGVMLLNGVLLALAIPAIVIALVPGAPSALLRWFLAWVGALIPSMALYVFVRVGAMVLVDRKQRIRNNVFFSQFDYVTLISQLQLGVLLVLRRLALLFSYMVFSFWRLDIMSGSSPRMDSGHLTYVGALYLDYAHSNNPVMLVAVDVFRRELSVLKYLSLPPLFRQRHAHQYPWIARDYDHGGCGVAFCCCPMGACCGDVPARKRDPHPEAAEAYYSYLRWQRVLQRWHLFLLLHRHPHLRRYRKRRLASGLSYRKLVLLGNRAGMLSLRRRGIEGAVRFDFSAGVFVPPGKVRHKPRWCAICEGHFVMYSDKADENPHMTIPLDEITSVQHTSGETAFEIATASRSFYLDASTPGLAAGWVKALRDDSAADGSSAGDTGGGVGGVSVSAGFDDDDGAADSVGGGDDDDDRILGRRAGVLDGLPGGEDDGSAVVAAGPRESASVPSDAAEAAGGAEFK